MEQDVAVAALGALAHGTRLMVFRVLVHAGCGGLTAGEVAALAGAPASTMSHHLGALERAGLIVARRAGRSVFYTAHGEGMRRLLAFVIDDCCQGRAEFCGPAAAA